MRRVILAIVSTTAALVLILSFKSHSATPLTSPPAAVVGGSGATASGTTGTGDGAGGTGSGSSKKREAAKQSGATTTITGDAVDTRYGPVQVKVTVSSGKLASSTAIDYPENNPRDAQINAYAIPALNQEADQAGSAAIDMISGATFTSEGYIQSLQSALDKAKA